MPVDENKYFYVRNCKSSKKMGDTLEMIYGVSPNIKQK